MPSTVYISTSYIIFVQLLADCLCVYACVLVCPTPINIFIRAIIWNYGHGSGCMLKPFCGERDPIQSTAYATSLWIRMPHTKHHVITYRWKEAARSARSRKPCVIFENSGMMNTSFLINRIRNRWSSKIFDYFIAVSNCASRPKNAGKLLLEQFYREILRNYYFNWWKMKLCELNAFTWVKQIKWH